MAKIRTLSQLQESLDQGMTWRLKEFSNIRLAVKTAGISQQTYVRAGIVLVYSHWEGFIKEASESYVNFVDNQGHSYGELKSCFAILGLKGQLNTLVESRQAEANLIAFEFIAANLGEKSNMQLSNAVNTESNLTSAVFANIAKSLGIQIGPYEMKFNLIDSSLVNNRNKIAHGEFFELKADDFLKLSDEVLSLIRGYKNDVLNEAVLGNYKYPAVPDIK